MKKKLLFFALPVLMAMSSCTYLASGTVQKNGLLKEDTLAHEELFGGLKMQPLSAPDPDLDPDGDENEDIAIGVQSFVQDGKVSFRFVAAVSFANADVREKTDATWHRSVTRSDGTFVKEEGADAVPECTTAYLSLSNGGSPYTIEQFNTDHGCVGKYTHFVVYSLLNVNLTTYANAYVSAYLSLDKNADGGLEDKVSKAIAINVERTERYVYAPTEGAYFMVGSWSSNPIAPTAVRTGGNKAEFENIDLAENASFVIKEFYNTKLFVHGATECLNYDGNSKITSCFEDDGNDNIKVKSSMAGSYDFYLSYTGNHLYTQDGAPFGVHNGFYVKGGFNGWAQDANYEMFTVRNNVAVLENVHIEAGQEFKVWRYWNNADQWYGWHDDKVSNNGEFSWASGDNIKCNTTGNYTIFLNGEYKVWVNPYN